MEKQKDCLYQVVDPINSTVVFESFDYDEIAAFIEKEQYNYVILDVVRVI